MVVTKTDGSVHTCIIRALDPSTMSSSFDKTRAFLDQAVETVCSAAALNTAYGSDDSMALMTVGQPPPRILDRPVLWRRTHSPIKADDQGLRGV